MARKNSVSVCDGEGAAFGCVGLSASARVATHQHDEVKEKLMEWIVSVAAFSGVEICGFTVMDNHLHLIVHVPPVPERYWLEPNDEPAAYAFGMHPPECRVPLWEGDLPEARTRAYITEDLGCLKEVRDSFFVTIPQVHFDQ